MMTCEFVCVNTTTKEEENTGRPDELLGNKKDNESV